MAATRVRGMRGRVRGRVRGFFPGPGGMPDGGRCRETGIKSGDGGRDAGETGIKSGDGGQDADGDAYAGKRESSPGTEAGMPDGYADAGKRESSPGTAARMPMGTPMPGDGNQVLGRRPGCRRYAGAGEGRAEKSLPGCRGYAGDGRILRITEFFGG